MKDTTPIAVFWFRRDLRLDDNVGLAAAIQSGYPVLPFFIFDDAILNELPEDDHRVTFIYDALSKLHEQLLTFRSGIYCKKGEVTAVWKQLVSTFTVKAVYTNNDYEPYAIKRDTAISKLLSQNGIAFHRYKDQVIFEPHEVLKNDGTPYTVYTPYKKRWLAQFKEQYQQTYRLDACYKANILFPSLEDLGFKRSAIEARPFQISNLTNYNETRDFPALESTSNLGPYLRFGLLSIRSIVNQLHHNSTFLSQLIWREFFMQILFHFPRVVTDNFKSKYDAIAWRNNKEEFELWCKGQTGYPMVDAGMRELNATGYMHNRVRMVCASFLCKHLLIQWQWGEAYFAQKLFDYELAANNGNWQWSAGTGCDAAPYFRVFNPMMQLKKFDAQLAYIKKWVPEFNNLDYTLPIVDHRVARQRALTAYKDGIQKMEQ